MLLRWLSGFAGLRRHLLPDRGVLQWAMLRERDGMCDNARGQSVCLSKPWL
jgi:hypothetical protein